MLASKSADEIHRNLCVEPDRTHVRLAVKTSKELEITKVLLRRTTTHRHIRSKDASLFGNESDMYLRVKETQDLIIFVNDSENVTVAHCAPRKEMVKANRQWWNVSLASDILNMVFDDSCKLKPGDKTSRWNSKALFGDDSVHLPPSMTESETPSSLSIGPTGLSSIVHLAETVVKSINAVGGNNLGPGVGIYNPGSPDNDEEDHRADKVSREELALAKSQALVCQTRPVEDELRW